MLTHRQGLMYLPARVRILQAAEANRWGQEQMPVKHLLHRADIHPTKGQAKPAQNHQVLKDKHLRHARKVQGQLQKDIPSPEKSLLLADKTQVRERPAIVTRQAHLHPGTIKMQVDLHKVLQGSTRLIKQYRQISATASLKLMNHLIAGHLLHRGTSLLLTIQDQT